MRTRHQITVDMVTAAQPSESDKYLLRLLKTELLTVELLLDVRELLQGLNPPTMMLRQVEVNADDKGLRSQD